SVSRSIQALVVTSPATIATPVLTMVSQATRARLSCSRIASSTASEIWSATLSGWPSETDSEVNRVLLISSYILQCGWMDEWGAHDTRLRGVLQGSKAGPGKYCARQHAGRSTMIPPRE